MSDKTICRRQLLKSAFYGVGILLLGCCSEKSKFLGQEQTQRPNFVILTVDDMNYNSPGVYGNMIKDITPNIDALAAEGMRFTNAHVNIAVCQPSRQTILTGRYPHRHSYGGFDPIFDDVPTLPEVLHKAGYLNGIFLKVGHHKPREKFYWDKVVDSGVNFGRDPKCFYKHTLDFVNDAKAKGKEFFFSANVIDPHRPFALSQQEKRRWPDLKLPVSRVISPREVEVPAFLPDIPDVRQEISEYYTSCHRADESVAAVLKAIKDAAAYENTVVIFLSDNGMPMPFAKTNCYLNSTKTPLIIRWPGKIAPGSIDSEHLVSCIDFVPTILDAAGLSEMESIDGKSLLPVLFGKHTHQFKYGFTEFHETAARNRFPMRAVQDGRYGYICNFWSDGQEVFKNESQRGLTFSAMQRAAKTDTKIAARVKMFQYRVPEEFYDFEKDPDGLNNLIDCTVYKTQIDKLTSVLQGHLDETSDPAAAAFRNRHDSNAIKKFMTEQEEISKRAEALKNAINKTGILNET